MNDDQKPKSMLEEHRQLPEEQADHIYREKIKKEYLRRHGKPMPAHVEAQMRREEREDKEGRGYFR